MDQTNDIAGCLTYLDIQIGQTLMAFMAKCSTRSAVQAQMVAGGDHLSTEERQRLRFACEIFEEVAGQIGPDQARNWLLGRNVTAVVDGKETALCPAEAIREGNFDEVRASASRMVQDIPL